MLAAGLGALATGAVLVLALLRGARSRAPVMFDAYLPPPAGHRAVLAVGERTLRCSCGWCHTVPWPRTSRRVNRARLEHCAAVEQARLARRLGLDADSVVERVLAAQAEAGAQVHRPLAPAALPPAPASAQPAVVSAWPPRPEPARSRKAAQARRASAIARVEAARVLPRYAGTDR